MPEFNENMNQMPPTGGPSLAGQPPMAPPGGDPAMQQQGGGMTEKDIMMQQVMEIPIDQLIQLVQSKSPEELAQMIQQLAIQQGMSEEEAISFSITLMKVIFERIQEETGQPITEITGQTGGEMPQEEPMPAPNQGGAMPPSLASNPQPEFGG